MRPTDLSSEPWLLPDGIEEVLPDQCWQLERLRRTIVDALYRRGYELVKPPLVEYLESLLTGVGGDLDLQTVKLTDQLSGRMMGVRADHTPQVARIDAHLLRTPGVRRLCYIGSVLRARPADSGGSRQPIQVGAELFGCPAVAADCEIIEAMLEVLELGGIETPHLDLGHVGIYRALVAWAELDAELEWRVFDAVRRKSRPDVARLLAGTASERRRALIRLTDLYGDCQVLEQAQAELESIDPGVGAALADLRAVVDHLRQSAPRVSISVDLAELRGYRYHTGLVFAAYTPGVGSAIAHGGRYDGIGDPFGRGRSATGFSADLRNIALNAARRQPPAFGIVAPARQDAALRAEIERLRTDGERVVALLPDQDENELARHCDRKLVCENGSWRVVTLVQRETQA